eukprot:TRINITY_DN4963_c0_g2_i12.p1 TRINITY_DN4963_c0_g2~~TRINITY_DN4963_c0_g2_i12.p1  ORF type:complete len:138 (-),score=7.22 TRINITY_DN4963_c0_g2_i12:856-1269(-)
MYPYHSSTLPRSGCKLFLHIKFLTVRPICESVEYPVKENTFHHTISHQQMVCFTKACLISSEYPVLCVNGGSGVNGMSNVFAFLDKIVCKMWSQLFTLQGYTLPRDQELSSIEKAEVLAYGSLLEDRLYKCYVCNKI